MPVTDKNAKTDFPYTLENIRGEYRVTVTKKDITLDLEPDKEIEEHVHSYYDHFDKILSQKLFAIENKLESRFEYVRKMETFIGDFFADILCIEMGADCA